jgi:hypothetical protein
VAEEDGKERPLTPTEMGALAATFEQKFPDIKVRFPSPEFPDIKVRLASPEEQRVKLGMDSGSMSVRIGLWFIGAIAALFVLYVVAQLLITPG